MANLNSMFVQQFSILKGIDCRALFLNGKECIREIKKEVESRFISFVARLPFSSCVL